MSQIGTSEFKTKEVGWSLADTVSFEGYSGKISAPFTLYRHDINGSEVLVVANHHRDTYLRFFDAPMQGPFTFAHVGGRFHRHTSLNQGTDSESTRLEGFRLTPSGTGYTVQGGYDPTGILRGALCLRGTAAKRCINVANILTTTGSLILGNYRQPYELLQTSGRRANNRWLAESGEEPSFNEFPFPGISDFELPDRGRNAHIFVEHFSAPGEPWTLSRGHLDRASEEYSPYNAMPWRNRIVRGALDRKFTAHSDQFGYDSEYGSPSASWHKVNRNVGYRIEEVSGSEVCAPFYDNWFIQHAIPQNPTSYAWITASLLSYPCITYLPKDGYISSSTDGYVPAMTFVSCSELEVINGFSGDLEKLYFVPVRLGLGQYIVDDVDVVTNTAEGGMLSVVYSAGSGSMELQALNSYRNGPYQYPSWKQVRTGEHAVARALRKQSIIAISSDPDSKTAVGEFYDIEIISSGMKKESMFRDTMGDGHTSYTEPNVDMSIPMTIAVQNVLSKRTTYWQVDLENNKKYFANVPLNNKLNLIDESEGAYEQVSDLYLNGTDYTFKGLSFEESVFPKAVNAGLARTRTRLYYDEEAGSNGYDRDVLSRRKIWAVNEASRGRSYDLADKDASGLNALDRHDRRNSVWPLDDFSGSISSSILSGRGIGGELHTLITDAQTGSVPRFGEFNYIDMFTEDGMVSHSPTASVLFCQPERIAISGAIEYGMRPWTAGSESGINSWNNTYDEFVADIRPLAKDMSIVPEFRISEHMERYIVDQGGNFRTPNKAVFSLDGGNVSSSEDVDGNLEEDMFSQFVHGDVAEHFTKIFNDHKNLGIGEEIVLRADILKRLLPYNGFYPVQRTLQLANLFSQSYGDQISGYEGSNQEEKRLQAFVQPFFAPGILYNTIKSGIAVDWAAQTGSAAGIGGGVSSVPSYACCFTNTGSSGNDDFLSCSAGILNFPYGTPDSFGFFAWIKTEDTDGVVASHGDNSDASDFAWSVSLVDGKLRVKVVDANTQFYKLYQDSSILSDGNWHYIGFSFSYVAGPDGTLELFVDGENRIGSNLTKYVDRPVTVVTDSSVNFCIGTIDDSMTGPADQRFLTFDGIIAESSLYYPAPNPSNVEDLYALGYVNPGWDQPGAPASSSLQHWWRMGDGTGDDLNTIYDVTGSANLSASGDVSLVVAGQSSMAVGYLTEEPNFRIPFEALISPDAYIPSSRSDDEIPIYLLAPSWQITSPSVPTYFTWNGLASHDLYGLAVHNFLGEIPRFFLKDGSLNQIQSGKQAEFKTADTDTTYYMDLVLYKTPEFFMARSPYGSSSFTDGYSSATGSYYTSSSLGWETSSFELEFHGRYFGPAIGPQSGSTCHDLYISGSLPEFPLLSVCDPAYAAYAPPYTYGKAIARLSYTPTSDRRPLLEDIHAGLQIEYLNEGLNDKIERIYGVRATDDSGLTLWDSAMRPEACIQTKGKKRLSNIKWNLQGDMQPVPTEAEDKQSSELDTWVLYPRFECPTLNFMDVDIDDPNRGPYGMWSNYGTTLRGSEGIYFGIEESYKQRSTAEASAYEGTGSLIDLCGFKPEKRRIGELADSKVIGEAIVAIPFRDSPSPGGYAKTFKSDYLGRRHLFAIRKDELKDQVNKVDQGQSEKQDTSIQKMIRAMRKYYLPPEMDFLSYSEDIPFVMYLFESEHVLGRDDLSYIWQGLMPRIARTTCRENIEFRHGMGTHEFFGGMEIPDDVRWMIFKVKRKAEQSYYSVTADLRDDKNFAYKFGDEGKQRPKYNYNWPYDFCSLVEYANISVGLEYAKKDSFVIPNVKLAEGVFGGEIPIFINTANVDIGKSSGPGGSSWSGPLVSGKTAEAIGKQTIEVNSGGTFKVPGDGAEQGWKLFGKGGSIK